MSLLTLSEETLAAILAAHGLTLAAEVTLDEHQDGRVRCCPIGALAVAVEPDCLARVQDDFANAIAMDGGKILPAEVASGAQVCFAAGFDGAYAPAPCCQHQRPEGGCAYFEHGLALRTAFGITAQPVECDGDE